MSVTRCHDQLSSCLISEKTNDPILAKFSDGWMDRRIDRQIDRQMDESDFIGRRPTNVERPIIVQTQSKQLPKYSITIILYLPNF